MAKDNTKKSEKKKSKAKNGSQAKKTPLPLPLSPPNPDLGDELLDTIPEDNSVTAKSLQKVKLSSASAVASSNSSQHAQMNGEQVGSPQSDVAGSAVNELMYGAQERPQGGKPRDSALCNKRARMFSLFLILLLTGIGVGIHFIVQAVDDDDDVYRVPTMAPTFPTFDDFIPAFTYSQAQIQIIDDVLLNLSSEMGNVFISVDLEYTSTPHGVCRNWLTQSDEIDLNVGTTNDVERIEQRYILCLLFEQMSGAGWTMGNGTFKDSTAHECTWEGVTCNGEDYVAVLDLWDRNLIGRIPEEIVSLETLKVLRLPNNSIAGTIPDRLLDLPDLLWLDLSDNQLTGSVFSSTASASSLLTLYLNSNSLRGTIPYFSKLTSLRIHGNGFSQLNDLYMTSKSLKRLIAYDNAFQGTFPQTWNLPSLIHLDLGMNAWQGSIPQSLWRNTPNLEFLLLNDGQLKGSLPSTTASPNLSYVWLQSNRLAGTVPASFGQNWVNLTSLQLQGNSLQGSITQQQCSYWQFPEVVQADCNSQSFSCACCTSCS